MGRNTFCQDFEYGTSAEVYWIYDLMILQLEECTKILKYLHLNIDLIFLFDNIFRHDRGIEYRLNVTNTNNGYGGAQRGMHRTNIKQEVDYLDPHERIIEVRDINHMIFQYGDDIPLWMNPQESIDTKIIKYDEP